MSIGWARSVLTAYRWGGALAYPAVGAYLALRTSRGKEDRSRVKERYGRSTIARPEGPLVWLHAASVGETAAVIPLLEYLSSLSVSVVLTTGTVTSARMASDRLGGNVIHQYVPLDLKPAVSRFLTHWKPDLAIIAESEVWPMTILELGARRVPQVLVNGRLSDRSFASWQRRSYLAEALFENLSLVVAQSELDAFRFRELGARPVVVAGNLKVDTLPPPADHAEVHSLQTQIGDRKTWAAISTHDGEEEIAADVHAMLARRHKGLLSIIVPRHPDRAGAVEDMLKGKGLTVARRSRGEGISPGIAVYLGDTIGEMGLYLRLTEVAFVGRSMTAEGGQNPIEPAALGTAVLAGQNVQNFREAYRSLIASGAAKLVKDKDTLAASVNYLFNNPASRREMIAAAQIALHNMGGALSRTLVHLEPYVQPLIVKAQLESMNGKKKP
jgi:3-deoxy-D-manno-octulosonic-acid transferase